MKLEKIIIVLENCECITVDSKYIDHIQTGKITSEFSTYNNGEYFDESFHTDYTSIVFKDFDDYRYKGFADDPERNAKKRLAMNDITSVEFHYSDIEKIDEQTSKVLSYKKDIRVPWHIPFYAKFLYRHSKWMYTNKYQKSFDRVRRDGKKYFCIEISKKIF